MLTDEVWLFVLFTLPELKPPTVVLLLAVTLPLLAPWKLSLKTVTLLLLVEWMLALFEILTVLFELGPVVFSDAESLGTVKEPVPKLLEELDTVTLVLPVFELPTLPDPRLPVTDVLL